MQNESVSNPKQLITKVLITWIISNGLFLVAVLVFRKYSWFWLLEGALVILLLFLRYAIKDWLSGYIYKNRKAYYAVRIPLVLLLGVIAFILKDIMVTNPQYALVYLTEAVFAAWIHDILHARCEILKEIVA